MKFTGERYVTDLDSAQISYEHWHRYFFSTPVVKDRSVLDIACGEGYGSHLLAERAKSVLGVDISAEAVAYAQKTYHKENLSYCQGSVEDIPISGKKKIDIVVSYETIEHVDHDAQKKFLQEVRRILMDDGIFFVSTPNKLLYSDIPKYKNEFHKKEFYEQEFYEFLRSCFKHVSIYGQKICAGSNIWLLNSNCETSACTEYSIENNGHRFVVGDDSKQSLYFIAVCSNKSIAIEKSSYLLDKTLSILTEKEKQIAHLKRQAREKDALIAVLQNEHGHGRESKEQIPKITVQRMVRAVASDAGPKNDSYRNETREPLISGAAFLYKDKDAVEAHQGIVKLLVAAGKRGEAVFALEKLVESYPDYAPAYNDLGVLHGETGNLERALAAYEKAVSLDPENATFRKNLGDFYYVAMKRPDEALRHYEKALSLNPRDTETLLIMGNIRVESGNFHEARDYYLKVLEIEPENELANQMIAAISKQIKHAVHGTGRSHRMLCPVSIGSREEYERYASSTDAQRDDRTDTERLLACESDTFYVPGFCYVCDKESRFLVDYQYAINHGDGPVPNWRERLVCPVCGLNNRQRALIHIFRELFRPSNDARIFISEQTTPVYRWLSQHFSNIVGSEFLGRDFAPGFTNADGIRNEDLTSLSLGDGELDYALVFDVFEHIPNYHKAFEELYRVLRPSGILLFSVPFDVGLENNVVRAVETRNGSVKHILPPEYHGDPLKGKCLCFNTFGWQLLRQLTEVGFEKALVHFYSSREFGYLGGDQMVFTASKPEEIAASTSIAGKHCSASGSSGSFVAANVGLESKINRSYPDENAVIDLYRSICRRFADKSDREMLATALKQLLARYPEFSTAHNDLGVIAFNKGDVAGAKYHYEKAVQLNPAHITALKNLADFYFAEERSKN